MTPDKKQPPQPVVTFAANQAGAIPMYTTVGIQFDSVDSLLATIKGLMQGGDQQVQLDRLEQMVTQSLANEEKLMATEQQVVDALTKIDAATTSIAGNLTTVASVTDTISTEVDALVAALQAAGVAQSTVDMAVAIGAKADAASTALNAQVPVLQAIAAKGVINPVPLPPPPPPPPPVLTGARKK
jgi:hypothetical protein